MLTKEKITEYLNNLETQEKELRTAIENQTMTLHAVLGAIQATKHLLTLTEENNDEPIEEKSEEK